MSESLVGRTSFKTIIFFFNLYKLSLVSIQLKWSQLIKNGHNSSKIIVEYMKSVKIQNGINSTKIIIKLIHEVFQNTAWLKFQFIKNNILRD